ncbi:hypothetical protein C8R45DRAFT_901592 [Mycena sanguinolenta]|nr:hypothetical protein C8R45DRAFT_901592 [Mycena sanguinolenta]
MAILASAPRQTELIPILCAIANFDLNFEQIDLVFELPDGEAELLLRPLHSVLRVPSEDQFQLRNQISSHHASFLDFLNNHSRSHNFYVGSLDSRMDLARRFLGSFAGRRHFLPSHGISSASRCPESYLLEFLASLPPSAELCPLIARMVPEFIFAQSSPHLRRMLSWLKEIPSVPQELMELWGDYVYMAAMDDSDWLANQSKIESPSSELCQVLVGTAFFRIVDLPFHLDLTWTELRAIICSVRPNNASEEQVFRGPVNDIIQELIPPEIQWWAWRDIALKCIEKIVNRRGEDGWDNLAKVLQCCPPCDILYREFQSIPRHLIDQPRKYVIQRILEWLQSFDDPTLELVGFWRQKMLDYVDLWGPLA